MAHKSDPKLGKQIHEYLVSKGVETPLTDLVNESAESKRAIIKSSVKDIMTALGLDMTDDSLIDTPNRVAKMYVDEIFRGLNYDLFPKCTAVDNKMHYDEMVVEKDVTCISSCEHHLVTIDSKATIAYIPNKRVLGLSKMNRIAKFFAQRPQIQERMTEQIFHAMCYILETDNVAVIVSGVHYCVKARGVEDTHSSTVTSKLGGLFKTNPTVRNEFMALSRK
jgi:GTP cyclohydrolase I